MRGSGSQKKSNAKLERANRKKNWDDNALVGVASCVQLHQKGEKSMRQVVWQLAEGSKLLADWPPRGRGDVGLRSIRHAHCAPRVEPFQPAHQSLITDVFRPALSPAQSTTNFTPERVENVSAVLAVLDKGHKRQRTPQRESATTAAFFSAIAPEIRTWATQERRQDSGLDRCTLRRSSCRLSRWRCR